MTMCADSAMTTCDECGTSWPEDRFNRECRTPNTCFRCRSAGFSFTLQGGKDYFKSGTETERSRKAMAEGRAAGFDPVPVKSAGVSVSASALKAASGVSLSHGAFGAKNPTSSATKNKVGS